MAKPRKSRKPGKNQQAESNDPDLIRARGEYVALAQRLVDAKAAGLTEVEQFDGSLWHLEGDTWWVNKSYSHYEKTWADRDMDQSVLTKAWTAIAAARVIIAGLTPYCARSIMTLRYFPAYGIQAHLNALSLSAYLDGEHLSQPQIYPVGDLRGCNCAFVTENAVMGFDPHVFAKADPASIASILIHEAEHIRRDHMSESITGNPDTDNILHDLEINDDIIAMGHKPLENAWLPSAIGAPDFLHAAEYLKYLPEPPPQNDKQKGKGEGEGEGEGEGDNDGIPKLGTGPRNPTCGSGSGGRRLEAEGKIPEDLKRGELELEAERLAAAKSILDHEGKKEGSVPANMLLWAKDRIKPSTLSWKRILPGAIRRACTTRRGWDRTDSKLSRKTLNTLSLSSSENLSDCPIAFATHKPTPKLLIVLDTSGSMQGPTFDAALSHIQGAIKQDVAEVYFVSVDASTYDAPKRAQFDVQEIKSKVKGGGGTDLRVVLEDSRVVRHRFNHIAWITDGYTPLHKMCPIRGVSNLFIVIEGVDPFEYNKIPQWGHTKVIMVKENG